MLSARFEPKSIANIPIFADIGKFYISIYCFHALLKNWGKIRVPPVQRMDGT